MTVIKIKINYDTYSGNYLMTWSNFRITCNLRSHGISRDVVHHKRFLKLGTRISPESKNSLELCSSINLYPRCPIISQNSNSMASS